jgi:hypothetical protein
VAAQAAVGDESDFLAVWGTSAEAPQQVFQLNGESLPWQFIVQPSERQLAVDGTLSLTVGPRQVGLEYNADIRAGDEQRFGQRVQIPKDFAIRGVSVTHNAEPVRIRWTRRNATELALFFARPLDENYQLTITGHCPIREHDARSLPLIHTLPSPSGRCRLHLFREDDTQVVLSQNRAVREITDEVIPARSLPGSRLVGSFWVELDTSLDPATQERSAETISLRVLQNVQRIAGESLTSVYREGGHWMSAWTCMIRIQEGTVDTLEVHIPPEWDVPGVVQSELAVDVSDDPELAKVPETHKVASIRFPEPLRPGDTFQVELRGPLRESLKGGVTVPRIESPNLVLESSFISVPSEVEGRPALWTRVGVDWAGRPPASLQPAQITSGTTQLFRVVDQPFLMRLQNGLEAGADAIVSLADVYAFFDGSGEILIDTTLLMEPRGLSKCTLVLPADYKLVDVLVGGFRCRREQKSSLSWELLLPSPGFPLVLEVVARREQVAPIVGHDLTLHRPRLLGSDGEVPTELTVWTVAAPRLAFSSQNAANMQPTDHALLKFSHLLRAAETGATMTTDDTGLEATRWSEAWMRVLEEARRDAAMSIAKFGETTVRGQIPTQLPPQEQLAEQLERLNAWTASFPTASGPAEEPDHGPGVPRFLFATNVSTTHFITEGGPQSLTLRATHPVRAPAVEIWLISASVVLSSAAIAWALGRPAVRDWCWQSPLAMGVAFGWLWWSFLWPTWIALVIFAASLLIILNARWTRSPREAGSATTARSTTPLTNVGR